MATLVATEEFPIKASVSPKPSAPVSINSNKLESGVRTVTRESTSPFVALKFAVIGGSGTEGKNAKGAAHFLSKAAFAGNEVSSGLKLVHSLESLGASIHAYSDKEKIVYDVKVLADRAEPVVSTVLSAIATPPHAAYVLDELRNTVQLDYNQFAVDSSAQLRELVQEAAFGEASALGASRLATNLEKLSVAEVLAYRQSHFVRNNVVVAASGGISQGSLDAAVSKHINAVPAGQAASTTASSFVGGEVKVRVDLDGASRFGLAFPVPAGDAGKPYVVLNALLAGALSAHKSHASTYLQSFAQGGLIGVEASSAQQLEAFVAALKNIASKAPEIDVLKQKLTLEHFLSLEGSCSSTVLLNAHLRGQNAQSAGDLRGVTADSVSAAAAAALKSTPAYAVLGATAGTPSYAAITKLL